MVYEDYFPIGTAPAGECQIHGAAALTSASVVTQAPASSVGTSGIEGASYTPSPAGSRLEKISAPDGRTVWVVKQR